MPGFPIRTPWDHSSVDSSPRPIAASHVLHRLLVPRHPPFALDNLTTENKMLASTVQFSTNDQPTTPQPPPNPRPASNRRQHRSGMRARSCLALKATPPRTIRSEGAHPLAGADSVVLSGPNRVLSAHSQPHQQPISVTPKRGVYSDRRPLPGTDWPVSPPLSTPPPRSGGAGSWPAFTG